jgi:hypothetical protein
MLERVRGNTFSHWRRGPTKEESPVVAVPIWNQRRVDIHSHKTNHNVNGDKKTRSNAIGILKLW